MLDAIADFWKPVKRLQAQSRLKPEELQMGSVIVFGFVPQPTLSGRRMTVSAINTYKFGPDILTSFVLSQDKDAGASMIIAETGGEQYLAISRRISISDRNQLFKHEDIEAILTDAERQDIYSRDVTPEYKGWIAPHYKRELHQVKGQIARGDHRAGLLSGQEMLEFAYTLLVSDNNEHALEIEKYEDGRVEVYATVYRRMSDVSEVVNPAGKEAPRPDVKLVSGGAPASVEVSAKPSPKLGDTTSEVKATAPKIEESKRSEPPVAAVEKPAEKVADVQETVASQPMKLPEFPAVSVAPKQETPPPEPEKPAPLPVAASIPVAKETVIDTHVPIVIQSTTQPYMKQEIKAVNKETSNFVNESIDCALQVANRIIDEAIRNEMRINDVVRRVIGLPVSQQESVQIPVTLTDQDYSLLAIRYGISAGDHEAIKRRITEDLSDFSGANREKKAA